MVTGARPGEESFDFLGDEILLSKIAWAERAILEMGVRMVWSQAV